MLKKVQNIEADRSDSEDISIEEENQMELEHNNSGSDNDEKAAGPSGLDENPSKKKKRGILYLSSIPKYMNVTILREMLSQYAKIGRIFLQPGKLTGEFQTLLIHRTKNLRNIIIDFSAAEENRKKKKRRLARHFEEGWVEFESKRAAKRVALTLNNAPIATRKSSKFYDILWTMKYLPRFKWVHLSERLTYEKAVHRQKLQTEMSQARRETHFFQDNLEKSKKFKKSKKKAEKINGSFHKRIICQINHFS